MTACLSLGRAFPVGLALLKRVSIADTTVVGREMGACDIETLAWCVWSVAGGDSVQLEGKLQFRRTVELLL